MKMKSIVLLMILTVLFSTQSFSQTLETSPIKSEPMTILINGKTVTINTVEKDGKLFMAVDELAPALNMTLNTDGVQPTLTTIVAKETLNVTKAKLNCTVKMLSNDSVGNEWNYSIKVNNNTYSNLSDDILVDLNGDNIPVEFIASEYDKSKSDYGFESLVIPYSEIIKGQALTFTKNVTVTENGGRYSGNTATIEFELTVVSE